MKMDFTTLLPISYVRIDSYEGKPFFYQSMSSMLMLLIFPGQSLK